MEDHLNLMSEILTSSWADPLQLLHFPDWHQRYIAITRYCRYNQLGAARQNRWFVEGLFDPKSRNMVTLFLSIVCQR